MELKKPVSVIEISNNITNVQRMAYNVTMQHFCHYEPVDDIGTRSIQLDDLCRIMNYEKKDFFYLDEQLLSLQKTVIQWNGAGEGEYTRVNFFAYTQVKDGVFYYRYDPYLERHIKDKESLFALLDMGSMRLLKKKHSLPLYELCARYKDNKKSGYRWGTPWFSLDDLKNVLTGSSETYKVWKDFKRRVLDPSIKEINEKTDLTIAVDLKKKGRNIIALKFSVAPKEEGEKRVEGFSSEPKKLGKATEKTNTTPPEKDTFEGSYDLWNEVKNEQ